MKRFENPYYELNINSYCATEIYVNDVLVSEFKGKITQGNLRRTGYVPINQVLLQSGKYKITGKMFPRYGEKMLTEENSYLGIEFFFSDINDLENSIPFHAKIESPWNGLSENINYPHFEITTEIEIELPFVLDGWQNSVDLSKLDEKILKQKVLEYYRQIHAVLKEHNASKFLELSKEKQRLQEQAFYFNEERKESFKNSLKALFNQNLELEPLNENELLLQFMGYGKLVRLMKIDGTQPFQFKSPNPKEQSNIELEIKLHVRTPEKGFSII